MVGGARVRGGPHARDGARVRPAKPARLGRPRASGTSQQDRGDARATGEARLAAGATRARHDLPDSVQPRTGNAHALRSGDYRGWRRHDAGPLAVCD